MLALLVGFWCAFAGMGWCLCGGATSLLLVDDGDGSTWLVLGCARGTTMMFSLCEFGLCFWMRLFCTLETSCEAATLGTSSVCTTLGTSVDCTLGTGACCCCGDGADNGNCAGVGLGAARFNNSAIWRMICSVDGSCAMPGCLGLVFNNATMSADACRRKSSVLAAGIGMM